MSENRNKSTNNALQSATAMDCRLGDHTVGSPHSRAAARALVDARKESEGRIPQEINWDEIPMSSEGIAAALAAARKRIEEAEARGERLERDWSPIHIPLGKENTVRGRYYARINAARVRVAAHEAEERERDNEAR
jgi:hypothetical protein